MIRMSPQKVRLVADLIRGKKVAEARDILLYTPKAASPVLSKLLESAVANAESKAAETRDRIDTDEMVIKELLVDDGITMKRWRAAPRRRAVKIRKRTSNLRLIIADLQ
jgi:large subunit ribosomal protein L22